jgi:chromosomal replication initiation ATPase DnaA
MGRYSSRSDLDDCNARVEAQLLYEARMLALEAKPKKCKPLNTDGLKKPPNVPAAAYKIADAVAQEYGFPGPAIFIRTRREPLVSARIDAIKRIRAELGLSMPNIGRVFGLHHTTILHALRR